MSFQSTSLQSTTPSLPQGIVASAAQAGIRARKSCLDLGLLLSDEARPAAALFTQNLLLGAHVPVCREHLQKSGGMVRAVLVNSGNANCSTGVQGLIDNRRIASALAELIGCPPHEVLYLSTGVIGARLPVEKILGALPELVGADGQRGIGAFAQAILTTDMVPKTAGLESTDAAGHPFRITGIAKGSGMIHPNMATMFGFLLTDAALPADSRALLAGVGARTFNRLTVDGDTSPNDTVILWSTGTAGEVRPSALAHGLERIGRDLCRQIAVDGEGATRLVTVRVTGAPTEDAAAHVGRTIATSPLIKTAVHGRDPNWGRILAAAGRAGVRFDPQLAKVWIGPADVYSDGKPHPENENAAHLHLLNQKEVELGIHLAAGEAEAEIWTCDFSADYVRINADYRS